MEGGVVCLQRRRTVTYVVHHVRTLACSRSLVSKAELGHTNIDRRFGGDGLDSSFLSGAFEWSEVRHDEIWLGWRQLE